jgi:TrkA domain protein
VGAIQRGERTVPNPGAETELRAGDTLVVVGTTEAHDALDDLLAP